MIFLSMVLILRIAYKSSNGTSKMQRQEPSPELGKMPLHGERRNSIRAQNLCCRARS